MKISSTLTLSQIAEADQEACKIYKAGKWSRPWEHAENGWRQYCFDKAVEKLAPLFELQNQITSLSSRLDDCKKYGQMLAELHCEDNESAAADAIRERMDDVGSEMTSDDVQWAKRLSATMDRIRDIVGIFKDDLCMEALEEHIEQQCSTERLEIHQETKPGIIQGMQVDCSGLSHEECQAIAKIGVDAHEAIDKIISEHDYYPHHTAKIAKIDQFLDDMDAKYGPLDAPKHDTFCSCCDQIGGSLGDSCPVCGSTLGGCFVCRSEKDAIDTASEAGEKPNAS